MSDTCDVPLLEVLDSVPLNGRSMWEVSIHEHRNIPYGNICQQAAMRIRQLERELAEAKDQLSAACRQLKCAHEYSDMLQEQLNAHKAALNLCQMALNSDTHETFMELKFEALSEISKLKGNK